MTPDEFDEWLEHHFGVFPNCRKWFSDLNTDDRKIQTAVWVEILEPVDLVYALTASKVLFEDPPDTYGEHPRRVLRIAKNLGFVDRENDKFNERWEYYKCTMCRDSGLVSVVHPKSYKEAIRVAYDPKQFERSRFGRCQVACKCEAGFSHTQEKQRPNRKIPGLPIYDPSKMIFIDSMLGTEERVAAFEAGQSTKGLPNEIDVLIPKICQFVYAQRNQDWKP